MILSAANEIVTALHEAGIPATIDARNVTAPGCFVTVTDIEAASITWKDFTVHCEVIAVVRDLGGLADLYSLNELVTDVTAALVQAGIQIDTISTNEQATPPSGGKLPAARFVVSTNVDITQSDSEKEQDNG